MIQSIIFFNQDELLKLSFIKSISFHQLNILFVLVIFRLVIPINIFLIINHKLTNLISF